jgi:hypothetical protein
MSNPIALPCDGCGQMASPEHTARRLQRLEWSTRYRPVHINTLFLGAFSPGEERDFLYYPGGEFRGEAGWLLNALGIASAGRAAEVVHSEVQRAGFFLTHVLECPLDNVLESRENPASLLAERVKPVATRIRRSLKPKRLVLFSQAVAPIVESIQALDLGCPIFLDAGKPYSFDSSSSKILIATFRDRLSGPVSG